MEPFFAQDPKLIRVLYRNVSNANDVRKHIFTSRLPVCLLKPKFILDEFQLSIAISKALHNQREHMMTTKSFPTELIYCLSPFKNITESLKTFGTEEGDTDLLIVSDHNSYTTSDLDKLVKGDLTPLDQLASITDIQAITSLYQISPEELTSSSLLDSIVSKMATKDYQL